MCSNIIMLIMTVFYGSSSNSKKNIGNYKTVYCITQILGSLTTISNSSIP